MGTSVTFKRPDGKDASGLQWPDGNYTISVVAQDANGQPENRKKIRLFSVGGYTCTVPNQGSTSVVVTQERQ